MNTEGVNIEPGVLKCRWPGGGGTTNPRLPGYKECGLYPLSHVAKTAHEQLEDRDRCVKYS